MSITETDFFAQTERAHRRKQFVAFGVPLLILTYLVYTHFAFDVNGLFSRAKPERAISLVADLVRYKIVVTRDNRSGTVETAVEGERASTFETPPAWVTPGETTLIDLEDGYSVEYRPDDTLFTVPGYGTIRLTVTQRSGVTAELPGPAPDWISATPARFDAAIDSRRIIVTRARQETHRFFWGWEEFWFTVNNPLYDKGLGTLATLALTGERIEPAMSNLAFMARSFWLNGSWMHGEVFYAVGETILMAFLGTFVAAFVALPLAFASARNFAPNIATRFGLRRVFDFLRGVDGLIWTIILSRAFGPGPMTGAIAIALTDTGSFGKLFSEALENVDGKQIEGVHATGASTLQRHAFGVIPQITPVLISQTLYYLESNMRAATIIGAIVGGGIGLLLTQAINTQKDWENVAYYVVLIIVMVLVIDAISSRIRGRLIKGAERGVLTGSA